MKIKAKGKEYRLVVKIKTSLGEKVDEKELDRFARIYLRSFLKPQLVKKNLIEYTGPIGVALQERLKEEITKRDFLLIMEQIIVAIEKIQANNMSIHSTLFDMQHVYINKTTKEIQIIYFPLVDSKRKVDIVEFLETIIYSARPAEEKDAECISNFTYFLKNLTRFDINKLEKYITKEDRSVVSTIRKQNAGQSGFITDKKQIYYEHYQGKTEDEEATGLLSEDDEDTGLLSEADEDTGLLSEDNEDTGLLDSEETGLLDEDSTVLLREEDMNPYFPTLFRVLTEEYISINKPVFRLGKENSYVDYFVRNNVAVSRSHADIITRDGRYFVKDLNSKNHTYVNDVEIPVLSEVEIFSGDRLRLGNEEFIFNI